VSAVIIFWPCGELLVCWHQRTCDIMGKKVGLSIDMKQLYDIVMTNDAPTSGFWKRLRWNDFPLIVGVIMTITGNLLT